MMSGTWGIIQARMGSTRLPGKVLMDLSSTTLLGFMIRRLGRSKLLEGIIIATTTQPADDAIAIEAEKQSVKIVRGSENDVLSRFILAINAVKADVVVRMTSDCPLMDGKIVDRMVQIQRESGADYVSSNVVRTGYPRGMDVEVCPAVNLRTADAQTTDPYDREHVMPYLYRHPEKFRCFFPLAPYELKRPHYRLCVDEAEDLELVRAVVNALGEDGDWGLREIIAFLDANPQIAFLNRHIDQKTNFF